MSYRQATREACPCSYRVVEMQDKKLQKCKLGVVEMKAWKLQRCKQGSCRKAIREVVEMQAWGLVSQISRTMSCAVD